MLAHFIRTVYLYQTQNIQKPSQVCWWNVSRWFVRIDRGKDSSTCPGVSQTRLRELWIEHFRLMDILSLYQKEDVPFVRISAPMVRYSKLPFRILVRELGVDLAYTPMIMADSFISSPKARDVEFTTCPEDCPLLVQLASKDPVEVSTAVEMFAPFCEGVDLNCGCPQKWAMQAGLGSALLRRPERIAEMIKAARCVLPRWRQSSFRPIGSVNPSLQSVGADDPVTPTQDGGKGVEGIRRCTGPFSVTAKLRIPLESGCRATGDDAGNSQTTVTVELVRRLASMGVDWITLHCRRIDQRNREPAYLYVVRDLVGAGVRHSVTGEHLPIVLNGDIQTLADAQRAHTSTGCSGVMVARGLLSNPDLFQPTGSRSALLRRWLQLSADYAGGTCFQNMHQQAYWMLESSLDRTQRLLFHSVNSFAGIVDWMNDYYCCSNSSRHDNPMAQTT